MEWRHLTRAIPALVAFVAVSSYLGLAGRFFFVDPVGGIEFMGGIWSDSITADLVFTAGTLLAGISCWHLAREHAWWSALVGALAHWLVYIVSFLLLDESRGDAGAFDLAGAAWFVASWGFVGLAFAALAPPLARAWWVRRASRAPRIVASGD